jgi:uncharacterized protein (DUF952 family)
MEKKNIIYHIVTMNELKKQTADNYYKPVNFENDGFIHCTGDKSVTLLVLEDYFTELSETNVILILEIDTAGLKAKVKFEPPAPIEGGGTSHMEGEVMFPHIYGSLNIDAVTGAGIAERTGNKFTWPADFDDIKKYL